MLDQMCHTVLSTADINAIRKARGFNANEADTRSTFENFFISSIGLKKVMASLQPEEVCGLHLLAQQKEEVDLTFFERVYDNAEESRFFYSPTFTQRYKDTFEHVKRSLVRKGILVMAEARTRAESTIMERWRFRFPSQFIEFLPPIIASPHHSNNPGVSKAEVARLKLLEVVDGRSNAAKKHDSQFFLRVEHGSLRMGDHAFHAGDLAAWQQSAWQAAISDVISASPVSISLVDAAMKILATLDEQEWAEPEQLAPALRVFCYGAKTPDAEKICQEGWKWGCLERLAEGHKSYFRLVDRRAAEPASAPDPSTFLNIHPKNGKVILNLHLIPLEALEQINRLAHLEVVKDQLAAAPDPVKLGRASPEARRSPLAEWLASHSPTFQQALDAIQEQWGKTILHHNLLVARVRDLSLRVQLERDLGDHLVVLSAEFVAFPRGWRAEVEKTLKKAGFVIKEVRA